MCCSLDVTLCFLDFGVQFPAVQHVYFQLLEIVFEDL